MIERICPKCQRPQAIRADAWRGQGPRPADRTPCRCVCGGWLGFADELPDQGEPTTCARCGWAQGAHTGMRLGEGLTVDLRPPVPRPITVDFEVPEERHEQPCEVQRPGDKGWQPATLVITKAPRTARATIGEEMRSQAPMVATLPDGTTVALPAGTVTREATAEDIAAAHEQRREAAPAVFAPTPEEVASCAALIEVAGKPLGEAVLVLGKKLGGMRELERLTRNALKAAENCLFHERELRGEIEEERPAALTQARALLQRARPLIKIAHPTEGETDAIDLVIAEIDAFLAGPAAAQDASETVPDLLLDYTLATSHWLRCRERSKRALAVSLYEKIRGALPPNDPRWGAVEELRLMLNEPPSTCGALSDQAHGDVRCALSSGHAGNHNTAADGSGDSFPAWTR